MLILAAWEIVAWQRGPLLLSGVEDFLTRVGWKVGSTPDLPTAALVDLAVAWLTLFLLLAEIIDLLLLFIGSDIRVFPNIPDSLTQWLSALKRPKLVGAVVSVAPLVLGIVIAKTVFT